MTLLGLHIGPPWWPVYLAITIALAAVNLRRRDAFFPLVWIAVGLLAVQVWKVVPLGGVVWVAFAATWVCIAGAIQRHSVTTCVLTLISAMCYPAGRLLGAEFAAGNPAWGSPLFWADLALVAAIFYAGGRGLVGIFSGFAGGLKSPRNAGMGRASAGCSADSLGAIGAVGAQAEAAE